MDANGAETAEGVHGGPGMFGPGNCLRRVRGGQFPVMRRRGCGVRRAEGGKCFVGWVLRCAHVIIPRRIENGACLSGSPEVLYFSIFWPKFSLTRPDSRQALENTIYKTVL